MVLPPQRGAHFANLRGHEHHLGLAKWSSRLRVVRISKMSSRLCAVRIFTLSYENACFWCAARARQARCGRATVLSPAQRAHFCTKRRSRPDAVLVSLSNWLLSNHTVNVHPRVGLRAKFGWDMTENDRK